MWWKCRMLWKGNLLFECFDGKWQHFDGFLINDALWRSCGIEGFFYCLHISLENQWNPQLPNKLPRPWRQKKSGLVEKTFIKISWNIHRSFIINVLSTEKKSCLFITAIFFVVHTISTWGDNKLMMRFSLGPGNFLGGFLFFWDDK